MSKLIDEVKMIAGSNAIGCNNDDIAKLSKVINYLHLQIRIATNDIENEDEKDAMLARISDVFDYTAEILTKDD